MHLLHFLSPVYYHAEEIASVSYSLIKKWKSISPFSSPLLIFFLHFFHAKERVMNELCLCEVAEIHLVVSNMDFHAGRSLMSLHLFSFCFFVCFYACSCIIMCVKVFLLCLVFMCLDFCVCVCFRCMSCVASSWGCQWNTRDHTCSDMDDMVGHHIIKPRQVSLTHGEYVGGMLRSFFSDSMC